MKQTIPILFVLIAGWSCTSPKKSQQRNLFDAGCMQVITVFANRTDKTLSILYGDSSANAAARSGYRPDYREGQLTLVTYHQADNRFWYGSLINGAIKSVETIKLTGAADTARGFAYRLLQGLPPADGSGHSIHPTVRTRQILAHKPVVFPQIN